MKTFRITIPKVHCVRRNDFLNKDKVYLALIVTKTNASGDTPKIIFSGISGISAKFRKNDIKSLNLGTQWAFNIEDDEVFNISFGLYEYDKGDVYQSYQEKITEIIETDGMKYSDLIQTLWSSVKDDILSLNLTKILLLLPEVGLKIIQNLRKDDLLGKRSFSYKSDDPNINFIPEFDLTESESHYKIQVELKKLN